MKEEIEHDIKQIKRLAFNEGFKEGVTFILEKCMDEHLIGNDSMIEYPKSEEEQRILRLIEEMKL